MSKKLENSLTGRTFNVRVTFDDEGQPVLGWVHGMFQVSETITDIKRISQQDHVLIAQALGITRSVDWDMHRQLQKIYKSGRMVVDTSGAMPYSEIVGSRNEPKDVMKNFS